MAEHEDQGRLADIEEDRGNGTAQTITIDPSGDICLAVESGNTSKELQVSSKILSAASSVFQTMFKPNFWEGLELPEPDVNPSPRTGLGKLLPVWPQKISCRSGPFATSVISLKHYGYGVRARSAPQS